MISRLVSLSWCSDDERFRIICADGADFVRTDESRPDVILVDGFDEQGQSPQLCSPHFYRDCLDRLKAGGVFVTNLCGYKRDYPGHISRIRRAFSGYAVAVPTECEENRAVFARKGSDLRLQSAELHAVADRLDQSHSVSFVALARRIAQAAELQDHGGGRWHCDSATRPAV